MENLLSRVDEIRAAAACFYAVDLHVHSPRSYDWDNSGTVNESRNPDLDRIPPGTQILEQTVETYREYIRESGRDFVAITDHNVSSFGEATSARNTETWPHVIPGIELSAFFSSAPLIRDHRIHVLAIFPEGTHHEAFARILPPGTPAENDRDPQAALSYSSVDQLIELIHREGGLAIAAHIESSNGLRGVYKNTTELLLEPIGGSTEAQAILRALGDQVKDELAKFDAIQVTPATDTIHYVGPHGNLRVPLIVASDCHKAQELKQEHREKYSFVKMARPSFDALKDTLKFPDLRVRLRTGLPQIEPPRLLGLRIFGNKAANTFFKDTVFGFSDNLTCLIGPRGSGKSAAIDALRYLMGYNRTLDQIRKVSTQVIDRQKHTLEKSRIEALYQAADRQIYKLVATYDPHEDYMTEVYDYQGNKLSIEDVEACGEFPLNLFGWGELELLAENPDTQRELLDRFITGICDLKEGKEKALFQLADNRRLCVEQARQMDVYFTDPKLDFKRLKEFKQKFEELNTKEIEALFAELDTVKAKRNALKNIERELQRRLDEGDVAQPLEVNKFLVIESIKEWADAFTTRLKLEELDDWILETNRQYQGRVQTAIDIVKTEDEKLGRDEESAEKKIQAVIGEDQSISGDLRNRAKSRYETAAAHYENYRKLSNALEKQLKKREAILNEIDDYDKRIFATRSLEANRIGDEISLVDDENYQIKLVLKQQEDKNSLKDFLTEGSLVFYGRWKAGRQPEILSANLTPRALVKKILSGQVGELEGLSVKIEGTDYSMRQVDAERLIADNTPYCDVEGMEINRVDPEKLDKLLRVQEVPVDDAFFITLGGKPIQYCSPGQRCSAMLPVVTLTSQAPLVIDQPEDNLDNRLVSRALFKILARLKEMRQIILATHNPNILVSGDAEQVLLLDPDGSLEQYGCIDDSDIISAVIGLMEGGKEAFQRRHIKYEPYLC